MPLRVIKDFLVAVPFKHVRHVSFKVYRSKSYFDINGYPSEKDDIDLILLKEEKPNYSGSYKIINEKITENGERLTIERK